MIFSRGMRDRLDKYLDTTRQISVRMETAGPAIYDYCCFGVDKNKKLSDERYMIFYNQTTSPDSEISIFPSGCNADFVIDLSRLPQFIDRLIFTVSIDGSGMMREMSEHRFIISQDNYEIITSELTGSDFHFEKAIISAELYRKDGWRFCATAAGFNGGLSALLTSYGGTEKTENTSSSDNTAPFYLQNNSQPSYISDIKQNSTQDELPFYLRNSTPQQEMASNKTKAAQSNIPANSFQNSTQEELPFYLRNSTPQQEMTSNRKKPKVQQNTSVNSFQDSQQEELPFYLRNSTPQQEMKSNRKKPKVQQNTPVNSFQDSQQEELPFYLRNSTPQQEMASSRTKTKVQQNTPVNSFQDNQQEELPFYLRNSTPQQEMSANKAKTGTRFPTVTQSAYGQITPPSRQSEYGQIIAAQKFPTKNKKTEEELTNEVMGKISLTKDKEKLGEHIVNLSKCMVSLSKNTSIDLGNMRAKVVVAFDYSGSMSHLYKNGTVQNTLNRLVPLGLTFDDNGTIDVFLFQDDYRKITDLNLSNYEDYVTNVINTSGYRMGGTNYAPVLRAIITGDDISYGGFFGFGSKSYSTAPIVDDGDPTFILFLTDGENFDKRETDDIIRRCSLMNVFIQFIGIGYSSFKYLQKLDEMEGRVRDNTGFSRMIDLDEADDKELYTNVLEQFSLWLNNLQ